MKNNLNETGYQTNDRLIESGSSLLSMSIKTESKAAYSQVLTQLIYDEMEDVFSAIKQNFEANSDRLSKANISAAYLRLNQLLTDLRTSTSALLTAQPLSRKSGDTLVGKSVQDEKKSFLVFKKNKYFSIGVDQVAFIYIRNNSATIMTLQEQEYTLDQSLDQLQNSLSSKQFFRLNRQYLVNFNAIKEVEHYFSRKLFVRLVIPSPDQLLIGKERATSFLNWMEYR